MPWNNRGGVNRLIAILLGLIAAILLLITVPIYLEYQAHAQEFACDMARNKAQSMIAIEDMFSDWNLKAEDAAAVADRTRYQRDSLCPAGGDYFILWEEQSDSHYADTHYKIVCGLHDINLRERTRLCAGAALSRLAKELERQRSRGNASPKTLKIQLNGKSLTCRRVNENPGLRYGTDSDIERKGTVCYYGLIGDAESRAALQKSENIDLSALQEGELWYFGYADAHYASVWRYGQGWSGDAWAFG